MQYKNKELERVNPLIPDGPVNLSSGERIISGNNSPQKERGRICISKH